MIGKKKKKPVSEQSEPVSECDNADEPAQEEILRNEAESEEKTEQ